MPVPEMFPTGWQTDPVAARASAGAVGARVAGVKNWPDDDVRLYQGLVEAAAATSNSATSFFRTLANDLRQFAPAPPPPGWGDLYRYAVTATGAGLDAEDQAWLSSMSGQLLSASAQTAADVKAGLSAVGGAAVNTVNAGANAVNAVANGTTGGKLLLGLGVLLGLGWALS